MLKNGVAAGDRVETYEGVAGVDEGFHRLLNQLFLVLVHLFLECLLVFVGFRNEHVLEAVRLEHGHENTVVLQVLNLHLDAQLLREVRNDQHRADLAHACQTTAAII